MTFTIITPVPHVFNQGSYFAYAPYVREMNVWIKQADKIIIVAPLSNGQETTIDSNYKHDNIQFVAIDSFDILSGKALLKTSSKIPKICWKLYASMQNTDHIHLRCPGNVGLLGCIVQILFPNKIKTAKYAGNWDPQSKQPWSYRLQKRILSNTFLTRKMQVLIYGEWQGLTKNCKSFFTASYYEEEKESLIVKNLESKISFIFVGSLVTGKNPMYAVQIVEELFSRGFDVCLNIYGEGIERNNLETYISKNNLTKVISLKENQDKGTLKIAYKSSHFVILPSESEGWPKALAEGMFWGCVPIATPVSCVPFMLDYGNRGVLLNRNLNSDVMKIASLLSNNKDFSLKRKKAFEWSQAYTLDVFESEIIKLIV